MWRIRLRSLFFNVKWAVLWWIIYALGLPEDDYVEEKREHEQGPPFPHTSAGDSCRPVSPLNYPWYETSRSYQMWLYRRWQALSNLRSGRCDRETIEWLLS